MNSIDLFCRSEKKFSNGYRFPLCFSFHFALQAWLLASSGIIILSPCPSLAAHSISDNTTDRLALLSFASAVSDPTGALTSWRNSSGSTHHCQWHGVTCGSHGNTARVSGLNLTFLNLSGTLSPHIGNLTFLKTLDLAHNNLGGRIVPELGRLRRLRYLHLTYNTFQGEIPSSLTRCSLLQFISLSQNELTGNIPANFSQCRNIQIFGLSFNQLSGPIPDSLGSLPKLIRLLLGRNNLTGTIPSSLGNLSSLEVLSLHFNKLQGSIPDTLGRLTKLQDIELAENHLLSGPIPPALFNITPINSIYIGGNRLSGSLPPDMGITLPSLQVFQAYYNQLEGHIPHSLSNASELQEFVVYSNRFIGKVPRTLGISGEIMFLNLGFNELEAREVDDWEFLTSLTNCSGLQFLDISGNKLEGVLPKSFVNLSTELTALAISDNMISGSIPPEIGRFMNLNELRMQNNLFEGIIPSTIGRLSELHHFYLPTNYLQGEIPASLGNCTKLEDLRLYRNNLQGSIPTSLGKLKYISILDLSSNKLNGTIPTEILSLSSLSQYLDLSKNSFTGNLPLGVLRNLNSLDVSENKLSGEIPSTLGACELLGQLYMQGNSFSGSIPLELHSLKGIQAIDLSRNNLTGSIPDFFETFSLLQYLNLSFNDLEGRMPEQEIFENASAVSVTGNAKLCGGNSSFHLPRCSARSTGVKLKVIISVSTCAFLLLIVLLFFGLRRQIRATIFHGKNMKDSLWQISYHEIRQGTGGFSQDNLIGVGSFGSVYKAILGPESKVFAVKVLNLHQRGASRSFFAECRALRSLRHRNLVKIITACSSVDHKNDDFKALVFEYLPNGSLEDWLHPGRGNGNSSRRLTFDERLNIAIDIASALDYLHQQSHSPIIHCDLKPSNVLLDDDICARVADFGLAKFLPRRVTTSSSLDPSSSIGVKGSIGYVAPEYGIGNNPSIAGDVYSYGILLLEMFTGKRPVADMFQGDLNLHKYVETACQNEQVMEIIDPAILKQEEEQEAEAIAAETSNSINSYRMKSSILSVFQVGVRCSNESPNERKDMEHALHDLLTVRSFLLQNNHHF